ncbi:butyrophilin subfamily 1 member A1-like [Aplochiton taeniatus]
MCNIEQVCLSSAETLLALVGDDVILPCVLKPKVSALDQVVEWTRPLLGTRSLHFYRDGRDSLQDQDATYRGRTAMFIEEMKMGNVSVKLSRVRLSDAGQFKCYLPNYNKQESWVTLDVGAVSQPVISIRGTKGFGVLLQCESGGWYPEPEVQWLDSEGHVLSAGPTETVNDTDGMFTVRRNMTVYQTDTNRFTCRVQQQDINQTRETEITVADDIFPASKGQWIFGIIGAVAIVIIIGAVLIGIIIIIQKKNQFIAHIRSTEEEVGKFLLLEDREGW